MTNKVDRFGNPINVGDVVAYSGTTVGLIIGVVVKMNPASYKIKYLAKGWRKDVEEMYLNVPFGYDQSILTEHALKQFDKMKVLNDVEQRRLGLIA